MQQPDGIPMPGCACMDYLQRGAILPMKPGNGRIWELDFLRGLALIMMTYFHLIYDMNELFGYSVNYEGNINGLIGKLSALLFMTISGISVCLGRSSFKRGLKVLAAALLVTLASYIFDNDYFIIFGILHFLGLCMLLSGFLKKLPWYVLITAAAAIAVFGYTFPLDNFSNNYFIILGFRKPSFVSSDYYPLLPYMGIFMFGIVLGKTLYREKKSLLRPLPGHKILSLAGRHTLPIYLVHQPVILLVLYLISLIP